MLKVLIDRAGITFDSETMFSVGSINIFLEAKYPGKLIGPRTVRESLNEHGRYQALWPDGMMITVIRQGPFVADL